MNPLSEYLFNRKDAQPKVPYKIPKNYMATYGLLSAYRDMTFQTFIDKGGDFEVAVYLQEWAQHIVQIRDKGVKPGLVLGGPLGTGKTMLTHEIARYYMCRTFNEANRAGVGVYHEEYDGYDRPLPYQLRRLSMTDLHSALVQKNSYNQRDFESKWEEYQTVGLLILDDLDTTSGVLSESEVPSVFQLIKDRCYNNKLTIITTNMPKDQFDLQFGENGQQLFDEKFKMVSLRNKIRPDNRENVEPW